MYVFIYSDLNENILCVVNTKMIKKVLGESLQMHNITCEPWQFAEVSKDQGIFEIIVQITPKRCDLYSLQSE